MLSDESSRRPLVDITGVANYLGSSVRHMRRLVSERRVPHIKVGGLVRFDLDVIDRWLADNQRGPVGVEPSPAPLAPVRSVPRRRSAQTVPQQLPGQLRLD
jgi:excisionase family DNA binding protein